MKTIILMIFTAAHILLLFTANLNANNIVVSNISLTGENTSDKYVMVQFDISWQNSWRISSGPANWDAAWVFVKYRISITNGGDDLWKHAWLNNSGHSSGTGTGASIDAGLLNPGAAFNANTNPGLGVFVYRSANGTGAFSSNSIQLRWNYGSNGVADNATVDVQVFAIEMVYVPQGAFFVGSGGTEDGRFKNGTTNNPFLINSEDAIEIGNENGKLWSSSTTGYGTIGAAGILAASFPKGFAAFYSMKYEITQQQYVDFLNTLTQTQANNRKYTGSAYRYAITGSTVGNYTTTNPFVACNYLSWMDGAAYADWAGLRPMTELEFEKASRGPVTPIANEYAWGTALVASNAYTLNDAGAASEGIVANYSTDVNTGNASYSTTDGAINGPLRVGIFAAHASNTGRITAGASYYGIMEMSGNVWERTVTVGNAAGRTFTGLHGDGILSTAGHANVPFWSGLSSGDITNASGAGFRGGDWDSNLGFMRISDRYYAASEGAARSYDYGFRAVRNIP